MTTATAQDRIEKGCRTRRGDAAGKTSLPRPQSSRSSGQRRRGREQDPPRAGSHGPLRSTKCQDTERYKHLGLRRGTQTYRSRRVCRSHLQIRSAWAACRRQPARQATLSAPDLTGENGELAAHFLASREVSESDRRATIITRLDCGCHLRQAYKTYVTHATKHMSAPQFIDVESSRI